MKESCLSAPEADIGVNTAMVDQSVEPVLKPEHRIREVSGHNADDVAKIARLHMKLLDFGPMSGVGEMFVREIGYAAPMRDNLLRVALSEVDGKPVGFVAYTAQSRTFQFETLKRHWALALWALTCSLLKERPRIGRLLRAARVVLSRRVVPDPEQGPLGEIAAMAVLPEYTGGDFFRRYGFRVSDELFSHAAANLSLAGVRIMRGFVDAHNKAPLFMYQRFGASFADYQQAGEPMVHASVELDRIRMPKRDKAHGRDNQLEA